MRPPANTDIESELSYAYLHAVASHAGMACKCATRLADNNGIDADLVGWGPFPNGGYLTEVDLKIQLKATIKNPADDGTYLSYWLDKLSRYDDLRAETVSIPRLLVVLFLPEDREDWIEHSSEALTLKKCAYWVSLRGAPDSQNESGVTIKIPKEQAFSTSSLQNIASRLSRHDFPRYEAP